METINKTLPRATTKRKWAVCPYCKSKVLIYDNTAECQGVWVKCTRGCRKEFELVVRDGEQIMKK